MKTVIEFSCPQKPEYDLRSQVAYAYDLLDSKPLVKIDEDYRIIDQPGHNEQPLGMVDHIPDAGKLVQPTHTAECVEVTFEQAWKKMKAKGYRYGSDALEQVRLGWEMRADLSALKQSTQVAEPEHTCTYDGIGEDKCPRCELNRCKQSTPITQNEYAGKAARDLLAEVVKEADEYCKRKGKEALDNNWHDRARKVLAAPITHSEPVAWAIRNERNELIVVTHDKSHIAWFEKHHEQALIPIHTTSHPAALAEPIDRDEEKEFDKWFLGEQGKPYENMWSFARAAWFARSLYTSQKPTEVTPKMMNAGGEKFRVLTNKLAKTRGCGEIARLIFLEMLEAQSPQPIPAPLQGDE